MQEEFGDGFIPFEYDIAGAFSTPETVARGAWYGVNGVPSVRIDGKYVVDGASSCDQTARDYRTRIKQRLQETGGVSPVEITGNYVPLMDTIRVTASFRLVDPATLNDLHAMLILYEDEIPLNGKHWQHVVRKIVDEPVVLRNAGDAVTVSRAIPVDGAWDDTRIHAVAFLQQAAGDRSIIQAARLPFGDFDFDLRRKVASIPAGNGEAVFDGVVTNMDAVIDTFSIALDSGSFDGWTSSVDSPADRAIAPGESSPVLVRVRTNGAPEIRGGVLRISSRASGRNSATMIEVFNGSRSILLVDDDGNRTDESPIVTALDANGYLYDLWDSYHGHGQDSPLFAEMRGYDIVLWQTGFDLSTYALDRFDMGALAAYLDNGGALCLASQGFLNGISEMNEFVREDLGVDSWTLDTAYDHLNGIAGDPIGDGLSCDLEFGGAYQNKGDDARPGATAITALVAPNGSHAILRNVAPSGARVVFMPCALHAVSATDPDPNNLRTLAGRIVRWLARESPAATPEGGAGATGGPHLSVQPNPARGAAAILFDLPAAGPVRLEVFDAGGRLVTRILEGNFPAGRNGWEWWRRAPGIYLLRLTTAEGHAIAKTVVIE